MSNLTEPQKYLRTREAFELIRSIPDQRERVFVRMLCHRACFCGDKVEMPFLSDPSSPIDILFLVSLGRDMYRLKGLMLEAIQGDPLNVDPYDDEDQLELLKT